MEHKPVSKKEMAELLQKSHASEHPYYYRFRYSVNDSEITATRIRKDSLSVARERRYFHQVHIEESNPISRAIKKIDSAKNRKGLFSHAGF